MTIDEILRKVAKKRCNNFEFDRCHRRFPSDMDRWCASCLAGDVAERLNEYNDCLSRFETTPLIAKAYAQALLNGDSFCLWCRQAIDRTLCHCGIDRYNHGGVDDHAFVPMGCVCGYGRDNVGT